MNSSLQAQDLSGKSLAGKQNLSVLSIQDLGMKLANFSPPSEIQMIGTPLKALKRALVVDNDAFFVEFLTELLEEKDYEVIQAYDGKEGLAKLQQEKIDIMFVDMVMPKIDGWQLINYTRKKYPGRWFPIVAVSGTIIEQLDKLESIGADYYIAKGPIEKMKIQFNDFMQKIEVQPYPIHEDRMVMIARDTPPQKASIEFMEMLAFQKAIMDGLGLGLLVCDRDTRVIVADNMALDILNMDDVSVLNRKVTSLFEPSETEKLSRCMKEILSKPEQKRSQCLLCIDGCDVRFISSLLFYKGSDEGWVLALEESEKCQEPA